MFHHPGSEAWLIISQQVPRAQTQRLFMPLPCLFISQSMSNGPEQSQREETDKVTKQRVTDKDISLTVDILSISELVRRLQLKILIGSGCTHSMPTCQSGRGRLKATSTSLARGAEVARMCVCVCVDIHDGDDGLHRSCT